MSFDLHGLVFSSHWRCSEAGNAASIFPRRMAGEISFISPRYSRRRGFMKRLNWCCTSDDAAYMRERILLRFSKRFWMESLRRLETPET